MGKDRKLRTDFHQHQKKDNTRYEDLEKEIAKFYIIAYRLKDIFRKIGWACMIAAFFVCVFDFAAGALSGTAIWSFSYNNHFGLLQGLVLVFLAGIGLLSLWVGYWKIK